MLTTPIFTRLLSPTEYGTVSLYTSWMGLFTVFATLEISGSVVYKGLMRFKENKDTFISSSLGLILTSGTISVLTVLIFGSFFSVNIGLGVSEMLALTIEVVSYGAASLYFSGERFSYRYKSIILIGVGRALLAALLSVIFISALHLGAYGKILGTLLAALAVALPLLVKIKINGKSLYDKEIWKFILTYNLPLLPNFIALSVIAQSGKIIIGKALGDAALGKFSVAYSLGFALSLVSGGIYSAIVPWIGRKLAAGEDERITKTVSTVFSALTAVLLLYLSCAPELFSLLAPQGYREALGAVYPIAVAVTLSFLSNVAASIVSYTEHSTAVMGATVSAAALSIGLNLWLIPSYGIMTASLTQLICSIVLLSLNLFSMRKISRKNCINVNNILHNSLLIAFYGILNYTFIENALSRAFLAAAEIIILIKSSKPALYTIREIPKKI